MAPATSGLDIRFYWLVAGRAAIRIRCSRCHTEERMFTNLIESSSHAKEFRRRGSFFLFTIGIYAVLFVVTGVVSIYAYDARLEKQNLELTLSISPVEFVKPEKSPATESERQQRPRNNNNESNIATRKVAMAPVENTTKVPETISTTPNKNQTLPPGKYRIDREDWDPPGGTETGPPNTKCCGTSK